MLTKGKGFLILMWVLAGVGGTMMILSPRSEPQVRLTDEQRSALAPKAEVRPEEPVQPVAAPAQPIDDSEVVFEDGEGS